jgi:hypothetical protein
MWSKQLSRLCAVVIRRSPWLSRNASLHLLLGQAADVIVINGATRAALNEVLLIDAAHFTAAAIAPPPPLDRAARGARPGRCLLRNAAGTGSHRARSTLTGLKLLMLKVAGWVNRGLSVRSAKRGHYSKLTLNP